MRLGIRKAYFLPARWLAIRQRTELSHLNLFDS
jgi:hypothetical protein